MSTETSPKKEPSSSSFNVFDAYEIQLVLGEGAYGMVYQARRKSDGALVALKSMPRALTGKTDFEREVAALKLLSKPPGHTNIVQLYDLHRDAENYYLVMELIEGGELLEHLVDNGAYSEGLAASFLRQFAEALCYVHRNGLTHADLKPENLLLSSTDVAKAQLKLADFGCARTHDLSRTEMHLPMQEFARGCSFLHMVALGNQFELEKMLQDRPGLVNFRDYDFRTPMHLAASEGHVDICRYLLARGGRVNRADRWGGFPLDDAHRHQHGEVFEFLKENGGTFGTLTRLPRFIQAASEGDVEEVKALLEFADIDLDRGDYDKRTALHLAAGEGRKEIVELLCEAGANVNVEDRWGNRPVDDAKNANKNSTDIISILTEYGGKSVKDPELHKKIKSKSSDSKPRQTGSFRRKSTEEQETFHGTMAYWPPELFGDNATPTPSSDMWATGIIMFILLVGSHPFDKYANLSDDEIREAITSVGCDKENHMARLDELVFDKHTKNLSDSCIELLRLLLHPDQQKRMTSENFLRHPWIQGLTATWTAMGKTHDDLKAFWQSKFKADILEKFAVRLGAGDTLSDEKLHEIFTALDLKKTGALELMEIQATFRDMGVNDRYIKTIFASADLDGTGVIHFDAFKALLQNKDNSSNAVPLHIGYLRERFKSHIFHRFVGTSRKETVLDKDKLREIFNQIDQEGNGILDPHNIRVVLRSVGEQEDVISRIVAALDLNRNGRVSWDDFLIIMGVKEE